MYENKFCIKNLKYSDENAAIINDQNKFNDFTDSCLRYDPNTNKVPQHPSQNQNQSLNQNSRAVSREKVLKNNN